ncbi:MAG: histidinol-phosphate transaminase [Clostridiales bacterium]|jgi:histidinol-phosphate aminotransferase|nr:histidinol-phosphate transaminase [Clostridiales bacterium]
MDFLSSRAKLLTPYTAGEQPKEKKYIKLNTNENPYNPSPKVAEAISFAAQNLRLYPDADSSELCRAIAQVNNVQEECVFCGNGSDEVLSFVFYAFFGGSEPLLFPDITYSFYPVYSKFYDIAYETLPLNGDFEIDPSFYLRPASGVIFPNPNAPTSVYFSLEKICEIAEYHKNKVVVIDEAYIAFGGESAVSYIKKYPNLLIVRTFSKSHALAGMRVGYAIGQPHLIDALRRVKDSFNSYPVDCVAAAAARAAVLDTAYYSDITAQIIQSRDFFAQGLKEVGFRVLPSAANFVFISHAGIPAQALYAKLRENGILVRFFNKPRIDNFLRVTIGTREDMEYVLQILKNGRMV